MTRHEKFINDLYDKNNYYRDGEFKVIGEFINWKSKITIEDKYGLLILTAGSLLKGSKGSITQAIDKEVYFYNILLESNPTLAKQVEVLEYLGDKKGVVMLTKYGTIIQKSAIAKTAERISIKCAVTPH